MLVFGAGEVLGQNDNSPWQRPPGIEQTVCTAQNRQGRVELVALRQPEKRVRGRVIGVRADPFTRLDSELQRLLKASAIPRGERIVNGADLYRSLSDRELAALLNLWTKARHIAEEKDPAFRLDFLHRLVQVDPHQLFADVDPRLLEGLKSSTQFRVGTTCRRPLAVKGSFGTWQPRTEREAT